MRKLNLLKSQIFLPSSLGIYNRGNSIALKFKNSKFMVGAYESKIMHFHSRFYRASCANESRG